MSIQKKSYKGKFDEEKKEPNETSWNVNMVLLLYSSHMYVTRKGTAQRE